MDKKDKIDQLLRQSMQLNADELPEPNPDVQRILREKILARQAKQHWTSGVMQRLWSLLNTEVKLYQAGLSLGVLALLFLWLPVGSPVPKTAEKALLADSIRPVNSSSVRQNKFLVQNFVVRAN
jgi:hypothetical protein